MTVNIDPIAYELEEMVEGTRRTCRGMTFRRVAFPNGWQEVESGWNVTSELFADMLRDAVSRQSDIRRLANILASIPGDQPEDERLSEWHEYVAQQLFNRGIRPPQAGV